METLTLILNIATVAVGLGFVIFFHELGHFAVAKWYGVKVEKFSIGFGPALLRYRYGETEYALSAFPLGGYVKMLGEGAEEGEERTLDPRAYNNQPVGARMAIISAGVLMNLLLGLICFTFAYSWGGLSEIPAKLGSVVAGLPAYAAGVRTGDEIIAIDGRTGISFQDLQRTVALSGAGQVVRLDLKRPGRDDPITVEVEPRREATADRPTIGIGPSTDLALAPKRPFVAPPGMADPPESPGGGFEGGDRVERVGPVGQPLEPVADAMALNRILARDCDKPLEFVVRRGETPGVVTGSTPSSASVTLPPNHFVDFGFRLAIGPIAAIQGGSIAKEAGFLVGDQILKVDGQDIGRELDPMLLPTYCQDHAGQSVTFEVERRSSNDDPETLTLTATPDETPAWTEPVIGSEPLEVPGLGLAFPVSTKIMDVKPDSPAAKAGLKPDDVIRSMTLTIPNPDGGKPEPLTFTFDGTEDGWPSAFAALQAPGESGLGAAPGREVELIVGDSKTPIRLAPEPNLDWPHPHPLRGLRFQVLSRPIPPLGLAAAIRRGTQETIDNVTSIFYMFRGLGQGRVSRKNIGGPILIAQIAFAVASSGLAPFISFLGMLSVNLAVLNFLPIPPLDGGQMAFLIAEKIRGRPLPESAVNAGMFAGLVLVLSLMAFFIFQDVVRSFF